MADFLVQSTLSNLFVATIIALFAWVIQRRVRSASLANLLWALVLIKLVTPPLFSLPIFEVPSFSSLSDEQGGLPGEPDLELNAAEWNRNIAVHPGKPFGNRKPPGQFVSVELGMRAVTFVSIFCLMISALLLIASAIRIVGFHLLLKANSHVHHDLSTEVSGAVARQLGLQRSPRIIVTTANIAPFVWWLAGRTVIVVSRQAIQKLDDLDLRLIITHEMAHIKRRDHWFRWLEWVALIGLWWNPVMWWARNQLRISEEMACDDLVLETASPEIHQYANALLNMAEVLASPAIRPPVVASAINSGGSLEKRLKTMIAEKSWKVPSILRLAIVAVATCIFPLGFVHAQDLEAVERRLGGAVESGELSLEQAKIMMEALKRSVGNQEPDREIEAKKNRYMELTRKIKTAVKAGDLSKQDAEKKLIAVRKEMFRNAAEKKADYIKRSDREMEAGKRRYMEFTREIEAAVEAGDLSKQDAEKKLIAVRKEMFRNAAEKKADYIKRSDREMEARKRRYMEFTREIEAAVEAGDLSKQDAEKKLIAVRKEMFRNAGEKKAEDAKRGDREVESRKRRYMEFAREIEAAVEAGDLSKQEAEKKLIDVRKKLFDK